MYSIWPAFKKPVLNLPCFKSACAKLACVADMGPKRRLITDTFKVVKRAKKEEKQDKEPAAPEKELEPLPLTQREKDLLELQQFDLDWRYGPCTGISRLQRWERAELYGLKPPQTVRDLLRRSGEETDYTHCLWHDYPL
ncbi:DNA polymerase delta subunit 4 isoform X1 [Anguilla rostrata]|uniref:DNA polymerase delta subunit 4 isoform X1 n=2 Tax=Anguilla rostrata TaxID=7938 RepID=UPI0030CC100A